MNNAFQRTARIALATSQRRFQSTNPQVSTTFLTIGKQKNWFSKNWLSDPSTYPLLVCLSGAVGLCSGVAVYFLACNKDVQIDTTKRSSVMRTWGN